MNSQKTDYIILYLSKEVYLRKSLKLRNSCKICGLGMNLVQFNF
jgi:hypothetical protein